MRSSGSHLRVPASFISSPLRAIGAGHSSVASAEHRKVAQQQCRHAAHVFGVRAVCARGALQATWGRSYTNAGGNPMPESSPATKRLNRKIVICATAYLREA